MKSSKLVKIGKTIIKSITKEIIYTLQDLAEIAPGPFESPYDHMRRLRGYDRRQINHALLRLEKQAWIKKSKKNNRPVYTLTDLGRAKALKYSYIKKGFVKRSDDLSTIIIFDIPEEKKRTRDYLRRFLVQNKFILLQESVFIGPWLIHKEFKQIIEELGVMNNVSILEGRVLHN